MEYLELIKELLPTILSIIATIIAFKNGKKTLLSEEQISAKVVKYQNKLMKKNKVKSETTTFPSEDVKQVSETSGENNITLMGR